MTPSKKRQIQLLITGWLQPKVDQRETIQIMPILWWMVDHIQLPDVLKLPLTGEYVSDLYMCQVSTM